MTPTLRPIPPRLRALRRAVLGLAVTGLAVLGPAPMAARADGTLVSGTPADGAALPAPPAAVTLSFSATPDAALSHVSVRDSAGREVTTGPLRAGAVRELRRDVRITGRGDYTVAFHVAFTDGSETIGARSFSVGTGVAPPPAAAEAAAGHQHEIDPLSAVLLVVDLAAVAGVGLLLLLRPRTTP